MGDFSSPGGIVDGCQGPLSLELTSVTADSSALDLSHLHVFLLFRLLGHSRPSLSEALIAFLVAVSESHICRRARPCEDTGPIGKDRVLAEWSMTILLLELVTVEIFSGCLAPTHEEEMVTPETHRICKNQERIHTHGSRNTPDVKSMPKVGVVSLHPHKDVGETGSK